MDEITREAVSLHAQGINVMPLRHGLKTPLGEWGQFKYTRLPESALPQVFGQRVNLGAMMGRTSGNLFSIDCDTAESFAAFREKIASRGYKPWIRSSVRGGHYLFRCAEGEAANLTHKDFQVFGHAHYIVLPPSQIIDKTTGEIIAIRWEEREGHLPPLVSVDDFSWLGLELASSTARLEKSGIPEIADMVLIGRNTEKYGRDNSAAEFAACLSLIGAGYSDDNILRLFRHYNPPHFAKKGETPFVKSVLRKARLHHQKSVSPAGTTNTEIDTLCREITAAADAILWKGVQGNTDKMVMLALIKRMKMDNSPVFRASIREVADLSGSTPPTVNSSLKRLRGSDYGFIHRAGANQTSHATQYQFDLKRLTEFSFVCTLAFRLHPVSPNGQDNEKVVVLKSDPGHDVWHPRALGKTAFIAFEWLQVNSGKTVTEISAGTGKCYNAIKSALAKMETHALVYQEEGKLWFVSQDADDVRLGEVAQSYNTLGKRTERGNRYKSERQKQLATLVMKQAASQKCPVN